MRSHALMMLDRIPGPHGAGSRLNDYSVGQAKATETTTVIAMA